MPAAMTSEPSGTALTLPAAVSELVLPLLPALPVAPELPAMPALPVPVPAELPPLEKEKPPEPPPLLTNALPPLALPLLLNALPPLLDALPPLALPPLLDALPAEPSPLEPPADVSSPPPEPPGSGLPGSVPAQPASGPVTSTFKKTLRGLFTSGTLAELVSQRRSIAKTVVPKLPPIRSNFAGLPPSQCARREPSVGFDSDPFLSYPRGVELLRPVDLADPELETPVGRVAPPAPVDLTLLTRAAIAGDDLATRRLLQHISPYVLRVVRAVLGARHGETEDVVQDVLVNFLRALPSFRGEASVTTFVSSIAFRRAAETKRRSRDVSRWLTEFQELSQASSASPSPPSEEAVNNLRRELLAQLLSELPKAQAETLVLRLVSGFSIEQIAEATDCPANTVRSRLRLGKEALRSRIDGDARLRAYLGDRI